MSAEETLRIGEERALDNEEHFSAVRGKNTPVKGRRSFKSSFGALFAIGGFILVAIFLLGRSDLIPSEINDLLTTATDVQYADSVRSKNIAIGQTLENGQFPQDLVESLKNAGYLVGYFNEAGEFIESTTGPKLVVKKGEQILSASEFVDALNSDAKLHKEVTGATYYSRVAYYYDDAANQAFKDLGVSRNNFSKNEDFETVMNRALSENSEVAVNTATKTTTTATDENGQTVVNTYYQPSGDNASSRYQDADVFVNNVISKNPGANTTEATLASADTLKVADTVSKERRSSIFYVTFMESISKMKAGESESSHINEAMNYLYKQSTTNVLNPSTGELVEVTGSPIEAPSLRAILSGSKVDNNAIRSYSSDRILDLAENKLSLAVADNNGVQDVVASTISKTVASVASRVKTTVGRLFGTGEELADSSILSSATTTIANSLSQKPFDSIKGIDAGELLVEGAVNVGRKLAVSGSGATAGDAAAVVAYQKVTNDVLALDAAADRMTRSPFDISSPNTFLGSLVRQFSAILKPASLTSTAASFSKLANRSLISIFTGQTYADATETYLTNYGSCDTYATIGAVGTGHCAEIATFDTSTLDPYHDAGFNQFVEQNTTLTDGVRTIKNGSVLADFILYNNQRKSPLGTVDGGILHSLKNKASSIPFVSNILSMLESFAGASNNDLRIASGAAFVNTSSNADWQTYKYAQRYVSLARATAALAQSSSDPTAYQTLKYFEGTENPVIAFLNSVNSVATTSERATND